MEPITLGNGELEIGVLDSDDEVRLQVRDWESFVWVYLNREDRARLAAHLLAIDAKEVH